MAWPRLSLGQDQSAKRFELLFLYIPGLLDRCVISFILLSFISHRLIILSYWRMTLKPLHRIYQEWSSMSKESSWFLMLLEISPYGLNSNTFWVTVMGLVRKYKIAFVGWWVWAVVRIQVKEEPNPWHITKGLKKMWILPYRRQVEILSYVAKCFPKTV